MEDLLDGAVENKLWVCREFYIVTISQRASLKTMSTVTLVDYAFIQNMFCFPD